MASTSKKRRIDKKRNLEYLHLLGNIPLMTERKEKTASIATPIHSAVQVIHVGRTDLNVQQAKNLAVAQAQQEGCTGNFRSFDSQFGNFLVPVIPTEADLIG
ncbi:hypothetical protein MRB53_012908 [Persea americana]|uniref:Uncharacterized protein n=1 Tax=Persea americana TaxID=3435 RepID=A0ACC2LZ36_PERAE|nr:hypothetical protein MRB53_012908 [Persea americana]